MKNKWMGDSNAQILGELRRVEVFARIGQNISMSTRDWAWKRCLALWCKG